ncbi:tetratricopeptide repeat protein [Pseudaminobacter sp. NGMCC 1.201702]|uniref:tetratricopeptide repeat protein n=1 Tax=Pseudaminobacter sp. NGMCC 1.201702 TaxID=3391825 RepID=UPI0039EE459C
MRSVFAFFLSIVLTAALPFCANAQSGLEVPLQAAATSESKLDALFRELKRERNERAAARIAARIQEEWNNSGSASVDLMMLWSQKAMEAKEFSIALDFLDQVVTLLPSYAEGWNRRATAHFMMHSFDKSMADIEHTLRLEPRHFGALAGMAQIMSVRGNKALALSAWQRVLDIYPMMRSAQNEVATLSEELAGEGI